MLITHIEVLSAVNAFLRESARSLFLIIAAAESQAGVQATIHPRSIHAPLRDPGGQNLIAALLKRAEDQAGQTDLTIDPGLAAVSVSAVVVPDGAPDLMVSEDGEDQGLMAAEETGVQDLTAALDLTAAKRDLAQEREDSLSLPQRM